MVSRSKLVLVGLVVFLLTAVVFFLTKNKSSSDFINVTTDNPNLNLENDGGLENSPHSLSITSLREEVYPGSEIVVEQTLSPGSNYQQHIVSYRSDGLKIYALLTVPNGIQSGKGWPVIIFNHGYIPPAQYRTTQRYIAYVDGFARSGYVVLKPDYRGHGSSEGTPSGAYGSNDYTIDVLNAVSSIKKYPGVDPERIGMWGHSMGGHITLRNMVVSQDVKAGVIWAGVVGSYPDLIQRWRRGTTSPSPTVGVGGRGRWRQDLIARYGEPGQNPDFWNSISANSYLSDISGPLQLHHGTSDASVPVTFSQNLAHQLEEVGKSVELYEYAGDDHNISKNFSLAIRRSIDFFDKYLK